MSGGAYKTPARLAVERAVSWRVAFAVQDIQEYAQLAEPRARQYLAVLVASHVLIMREDGRYEAGPQAEVWRKTPPKSRPGGNDPVYRARRAVLDRWRQQAWQNRGHTDVPQVDCRDARARARRPVAPAYTVGEIAAMCGRTTRCVQYWLRRGILLAIREPGCSQLVPHEEMVRFLEGRPREKA